MANKITYADKVAVNPQKVHINQFWAEDANELKNKHNLNDDRINALATSGALTYQTLVDLNAVTPVPAEGTPAKVANDGDADNNGYYSVVSGVWVKDASGLWNGYELIDSLADFDNAIGASTFDNWMILSNFTLDANKTIPTGITLHFNGGIISGAFTLTGTDTSIISDPKQIFDIDVILDGVWKIQSVYPEWFGAIGDGINNDRPSLIKAIDLCKSSHRVLTLTGESYGISSEIEILEQINLQGSYSKGENITKTSIKKLTGFTGDAALTFGDGATGLQGLKIESLYIDGNGQLGKGLYLKKCAHSTLRDVQVENNQGVGIEVDGLWISNWYNIASRANTLGGMYINGGIREVSDFRIFGSMLNQNETYQLKIGGTHGSYAVDLYSPILELPATDSPLLLLGKVDRSRIFGGQIAQKINYDSLCVTVGDASGLTSNLIFNSTYFQFNPTTTSLSAVEIINGSSIDFMSCFNQGAGKFIKVGSSPTLAEKIHLFGGNYLISDIDDTNKVVGLMNLDNYKFGNINNDGILQILNQKNGKRIDLGLRDSAGSSKFIRIGQGTDNDEFGFQDISARLVQRTSAPANPQKGRIELCDGVSWNPLGTSSEPYLVWYTGGAWQSLNKTSGGTVL